MVCNDETIDQLTQKQHNKKTEKVVNFQQPIWYLAEDHVTNRYIYKVCIDFDSLTSHNLSTLHV